MTKSTGKGRGGARAGAGRKPKIGETGKQTERKVASAAKTIADSKAPSHPINSPDDLVAEAYATLRDVMANSPFPAPRVTAARAVLDLAKGDSGKGAGGKKGERAAAASKVAAGGRFAPPAPPKLVVSNA